MDMSWRRDGVCVMTAARARQVRATGQEREMIAFLPASENISPQDPSNLGL